MSAFDVHSVDVEHFLESLEVENLSHATRDEMRFSCPFPGHANGDENASAYMNIETTAFFCHGCKRRGNAIHFTSEFLEISPFKAISLLKQRYAPELLNPSERGVVGEVREILAGKTQQQEEENSILPMELIDEYAVDWDAAWHNWDHEGRSHPACDYMFERGFDPVVLEEWGFGYDPDTDRVVFPVCDERGQLVGFKARAYQNIQPKYLVLGDTPGRGSRWGFPRYHTGQVVFGMDKAIEGFETLDHGEIVSLIVCEGELNVVAMYQKGWRNAVAINGSNPTDRQLKIIKSYADEVIVFFDSDEAGDSGALRVREALRDYLPVYIAAPHEGDPATMSIESIQKTLTNKQSDVVLAVQGH